MKTAELLRQRLELIYRWHQVMVYPDTGLLEYLYLPKADRFIRERHPHPGHRGRTGRRDAKRVPGSARASAAD